MGGSCISRPKRIRKRIVAQVEKKSEDIMHEKVHGESERSENELFYPIFEPAWKSNELKQRELPYIDVLLKAGLIENSNSFVKNFVTHRFYLYSSIDASKAFQQTYSEDQSIKSIEKIDKSLVWFASFLEATIFGGGENYRFQCNRDNEIILTNSLMKEVSEETAYSLLGVQYIVRVKINVKKEIEMTLAPIGKEFVKMIEGIEKCKKINLDKNCMINGILLKRDINEETIRKDGGTELSEMNKIILFLHEKIILTDCDEIFCYFNPLLNHREMNMGVNGFNTYLEFKAFVEYPEISITKLFDIGFILEDKGCEILCVYILVFCLKVCMAGSSNTNSIPMRFLKNFVNMEDDAENWLSRVTFIMKFMYCFCEVQNENSKENFGQMVDKCCKKILQISLLNSHIIIDAYLIEFSIELDEKHLAIRQNPLLQINHLIKYRMMPVKRTSLLLVNEIKVFMKQIMPDIMDMIPSRKSLNTFSEICKIMEDKFNKWEDKALRLVKENVNEPYFNSITSFGQLAKNESFVHKSFTNDLLISSEFLFSLKIYLFVCKVTHLVNLFSLKEVERRKNNENITIVKRLWEEIISDFMLNSIYAYCSGELAVTIFTFDGLVKRLDMEGCEEEEAIFTKALEIWFRCNRDPRAKYSSSIDNFWGFYILKVLITVKTEALPNFETNQEYFSLNNLLECFSIDSKKDHNFEVNNHKEICKNIPLNKISGIFYSKMELLSPMDEDQSSLLKTGSSFFDKSGENMSSKSGYSENQNKGKKCPRKRILNQANIPEINCIRSGVYQWGKGINCSPLLYPPTKNIDVFRISCGNYHVVIAASIGVFGWGENGSGQLAGPPSKNNITTIKEVYSKSIERGTVELSCGNEHTAILIKEEPLVMFGQSEGGIISGHGHKFDKISCGGLHSLGLRDGNVYSWGRGEGGQLGHKTSVLKTKVKEESTDFFLDSPKKIENLPKIKKSVCGDAHSILLSENGEVYVFGFAYQGQLGLGLTGDSDVFQIFEPVKLELKSKDMEITDIFAGSTASFFKTSSGEIFSCGLNDCNQLGKEKTMKIFQKKKYIGKPQNQKHSRPGEAEFSRPGKIEIFNKQMKVNKIACGENHCLASVEYLKKNKMIMGWGLNKQFQISCEFPTDSITPRTVGNVYDYSFDDICCGSIFSLGIVLNEGRMGVERLDGKIEKFIGKSFSILKL